MKNGKRILSVTVKQMADEYFDASHLGEYSNRSKSNYAIDRKHAKECFLHTAPTPTIELLTNAKDHLANQHDLLLPNSGFNTPNYQIVIDLSEAIELIDESIDQLGECSCDESGYWSHGELQYFNPNFENYAGCTEEEIREYCWQDYERMESLNSGSWYYIGIRAVAEIQLGTAVVQKITSGGLWGIESDSDKSYFEEVASEELSELKNQLLAIGFSKRAIATAFKNVKESA